MKDELEIEENNCFDLEEIKYQRWISFKKELSSEEIISFDNFDIKKNLKVKSVCKPPQGRSEKLHNRIINFNKKNFR